MNRRGFLAFLGAAPVAAGHCVAAPATLAPVAQDAGQPVQDGKASDDVPERGVGIGSSGQSEECVAAAGAGEASANADDPAPAPDAKASPERAFESTETAA